MKLTRFFFGLSVVFVGLFGFTSCVKDAVEDLTTHCSDTSDGCGGTFKSCTNGTKSWYEYKGKTYNCASNDCTDAAEELADDMEDACN